MQTNSDAVSSINCYFFFVCGFSILVTACADGTCGAFDAQTGERISAFKGHTASITCCTPTRTGPELTASGSIDGSVKVLYTDTSHFPFQTLLSAAAIDRS